MKTHDNSKGDICRYSLFRGWMLDNGMRRLFQNPKNIISDYVAEGMTAIDIGCGTGMFTLAMAEMVGNTGTVIAVDVQQEMVDQVRLKSRKQNLISRIQFHKSEPNQIGVVEKADFILSFYMVHEVPDRDVFLKEVHGLLKPGGKYLVVEPVFHVSEIAFNDTIRLARSAGFRLEGNPKMWLSRAALFSLAD